MNKYQVIELQDQDDSELKSRDKFQAKVFEGDEDLNDQRGSYEFDDAKKEIKTTAGSYPQLDYENELNEIHPSSFPQIPSKTILLTLFLLFTGIGFACAGIMSFFEMPNNGKTLTYLLFGMFLMIPGGYYSYYLLQAYRASTPEEREEILDQIPV